MGVRRWLRPHRKAPGTRWCCCLHRLRLWRLRWLQRHDLLQPQPYLLCHGLRPRRSRLVMGLGLFMMASGGIIYYMLNAYEPPVPDTFLSYFCKEPALSIRFRPSAQQIRFATPKGTVTTTVIEDRIVWDDYREAGARLALAPPVKILMADAGKLVVNGGVFDNTTCEAAAQR